MKKFYLIKNSLRSPRLCGEKKPHRRVAKHAEKNKIITLMSICRLNGFKLSYKKYE
jgi:hypothetical protein